MAKAPTRQGKKGSLYLHPDRKKKMRRPEQAIQIAVATELYKLEALSKQQDFFFFHPPQGGWRSPVEAGIMQGMGVRAGISDLFVMFPKDDDATDETTVRLAPLPARLLIIEFKAGSEKDGACALTKDQVRFGAIAQHYGFHWQMVAAKDTQDGVVQTLRLMLPHLRPGCRTEQIIKKYIFPGGVRV